MGVVCTPAFVTGGGANSIQASWWAPLILFQVKQNLHDRLPANSIYILSVLFITQKRHTNQRAGRECGALISFLVFQLAMSWLWCPHWDLSTSSLSEWTWVLLLCRWMSLQLLLQIILLEYVLLLIKLLDSPALLMSPVSEIYTDPSLF